MIKDTMEIRLVQESDAASIAEIYRPYVENTTISFEYIPPSVDEMLQRIRTISTDFPWLVCLKNDQVIGYANASTHRHRTAYQWSIESSIYFSEANHLKGVASITYEVLFSILQLQGFYTLLAGVTTPNDKSVGFHKAMGFKEIGTFKNIGFKFGKWHDTQWFTTSTE